MDSPKFCCDCKFYLAAHREGSSPADFCWHPERVSLVTGYAHSVRAEVARGRRGDCGPDAKLFEQAPPPEIPEPLPAFVCWTPRVFWLLVALAVGFIVFRDVLA